MVPFINAILVKNSLGEEAILRKRFWAVKQQYNALLGECLPKLEAMRRDSRFGQAKELYKQKGEKTEGKPLCKALEKEYAIVALET